MRLTIILIGIITFQFQVSCSAERKQESVTETSVEYPDQESWQATIQITKDGRTVGMLEAGHIQKFSKKNITLMKSGLKVDFYDMDGNHTSVLNSESGKVFDDRQDMLAYGNVIVVSDSGLTLFSDTLKWNNKEQKIYSDVPVKIISDEADTLYGDSFKSDPGLINYEIVNPHGKSSKSLTIE